MPIVWHAALTGSPLRSRVAGADLVPALVERSCRTGWRVLLFGSAEGVAESAAALLRERSPGAVVHGISGPILADPRRMDDVWIDEIRAFAPDIICVALGNPKQERWIDAHRSRLGAAVLIGVGGTLDFLVGGRRRAPNWMRRAGLEWLFRAAQEPKRLGKRYGHDAVVFGPHLLRAIIGRVRGASAGSRLASAVVDEDGVRRISLEGREPTANDLAVLCAAGRTAHRSGERVVVTGADRWSASSRSEIDPHGVFEFR
jgi:N-acetylglucosaminyldiphosphoundecaprenol N-acetyl-beta-D-mannosaminyltransferase